MSTIRSAAPDARRPTRTSLWGQTTWQRAGTWASRLDEARGWQVGQASHATQEVTPGTTSGAEHLTQTKDDVLGEDHAARDLGPACRVTPCEVRPSCRKLSVSWASHTGPVCGDPASSGIVVVRRGGQVRLPGCSSRISCMPASLGYVGMSLKVAHPWTSRGRCVCTPGAV